MPITLTIDHASQRVFARAVGSITVEEIRRHLEEERVASGLPHKELIDARGSTTDFSAEGVRVIVLLLERLGEAGTLGPTAVVVDSDVGYGMLRMLEMLVEPVCRVRPFRRVDEATEWLDGLTPDAL